MLKTWGKYLFMVELGYKYIKIFKKTFFHPFITLQPGYKQLSIDRQNYSNTVLDFLNIEVEVHGELPQKNKILYSINHRSLLDIMVMEHIFKKGNKNGSWIAKQELLDAIYGKFFEYSGCMSVDLENAFVLSAEISRRGSEYAVGICSLAYTSAERQSKTMISLFWSIRMLRSQASISYVSLSW